MMSIDRRFIKVASHRTGFRSVGGRRPILAIDIRLRSQIFRALFSIHSGRADATAALPPDFFWLSKNLVTERGVSPRP